MSYTKEDLKRAAQLKNVQICEDYEKEIGFQLTPYTWFWWKEFSCGTLIYSHSYSQRTGAKNKNWRRKYLALKKLGLLTISKTAV